ncbi:carbohydrate ABC transporter permease, partial [Ochrobactrum sp. C6C9]|nr:carbohydrate ABC transporter permease [Ochrobactrum sp. C6C9]
MPRQRVRKGWRKWVNTVNVSGVVIAVLTALPLYWLVSTSLKPASEIGQSPPTAFPQSFTLDNFVVAFRDNALGQYMV